MKKIIFLLIIALTAIITSCNQSSTVDETDTARQDKIQKEEQAELGMPAIHNFQEKKLLKNIYEMRDDEKLICYAYLYNGFQGKLIFIGKCLGYGIPYSTQYSNPEKVVNDYSSSFGTLPQAEPNGLFMPSSSQGTWVMLLDSIGNPHPVYIEPEVIVSPFKLTIE